MDAATARANLERMVAASAVPALTSDEVVALLALAERNDPDGRTPDDPDWTGAYDLNAAASEGWRWKAGKVAGEATFSADGTSVNKGDLHKSCLAMADHYAKVGRGGGTMALGSIALEAERLPGRTYRLPPSGVVNLA